MKKSIFTLLLLIGLLVDLQAQTNDGGFPLSLNSRASLASTPLLQYPLPDWDKAEQQNKQKAASGLITPYVVGLFTGTDISFPQSGSFTYLNNGHRIWKAQLKIENAPAIGLYYDRFHLPKGVSFFLSNESNSQVLGSYSSKNNSDNRTFANEPVQGEWVNIELDMDPGVLVGQIDLHINRALVYFTSIDYLDKYKDKIVAKPTGEPDPFNLEGSSSTCELNAICPLGNGYSIQRKATIQLIIPLDSTSAGSCSATMINNTGNTVANCKPYILTATHCDGNNYTSSAELPFAAMLVRFNFEKESCTGGAPATVNTLNGVNLIARANYIDGPQTAINGDFMLLELKQSIPASWDVYLAGWNRADSLPATLTAPAKYIGFHHAAADVKKVSSSQHISPNGDAGGAAGTHWKLNVENGGVEQGSSGSSLFDANGYSVGIASVATDPDASCNINGKGGQALFLKEVYYSKLSYDWEYSLDGTTSLRRLKPWLDPLSTNALTLGPVKSDCSVATTGISNTQKTTLENAILIYPNPLTTATLNIALNLDQTSDITLELFGIDGKRVALQHFESLKNNKVEMDMTPYSNGIYLLKFTDKNNVSISKKLMLAK